METQNANQQPNLNGPNHLPSRAGVYDTLADDDRERGFGTPAHYTDATSRRAGVLQNIQVLMASQGQSATLATVAEMIQDLQASYGAQAPLEEVIQSLVGLHLQQAYLARRQRQQEAHR